MAQDITQLKKQLNAVKSDTARVRLLNEIAATFFVAYEYDSCKHYAMEALNGATQLMSKEDIKKNPAYNLACKKLYAKAVENMGCAIMYVNTTSAVDTFMVADRLCGGSGAKIGLTSVFLRIG